MMAELTIVRSLSFLILGVLVFSDSADAQREASALPSEMIAMETTLLARVGPQTRDWIKEEADRRLASTAVSEADVLRAAAGYPFGRLTNQDIEAIAFIVIMEAAKSAREDLKAIMDGVKAINNAKAAYVNSTNRTPIRSKEDLECLERMSTTESLRYQMAMDRVNKFMQTLSNLSKRLAETQNSLIQNLK